MIPPLSESGRLLWRLLPRLYRERDGVGGVDPERPTQAIEARGDLANYLDAFGIVLDELKGTIRQRLLDTSPDTCQPWLIPYFADLLDVRLVSPDLDGQREEVARAVSWRKRKGTVNCIAEIAERVGRLERVVAVLDASGAVLEYRSAPTVLVQEGFRRVATTVSIGAPLPTPSQLGEASAFAEAESPIAAVLNPALSPGTLDFRYLSRARETTLVTLAMHENAFTRPLGAAGTAEASVPVGVQVRFRQEHPRGIPCHPDTYQDASVRTVDMRSPNHAVGHHHPRRVLLYAEPESGFFSDEALKLSWQALGTLLAGQASPQESVADTLDGRLVVREHWTRSGDPSPPVPGFCLIERELTTADGLRQLTRIAGLRRAGSEGRPPVRREAIQGGEEELVAGIEVIDEYAAGSSGATTRRTLRGFGDEPPGLFDAAPSADSAGAAFALRTLGASPAYVLEDVVVFASLRVDSAQLELRRVAIQRLVMRLPPGLTAPLAGSSADSPALLAVDSLFAELDATGVGTCQLEYTTVLERLKCSALQASDSILLGTKPASLQSLFLRYSAVPWLAREPQMSGRVFEPSITREEPLFLETVFGRCGSGVLHPACPRSLREGAEDGGELGAYHHRHYVRREQALIDKLKEFLPVTLEPALIPHRPWAPPIRPR